MSQTTSAFLGCILELILACVFFAVGRFWGLHCAGCSWSGVCWAHLLVPLVHLHSWVSECSVAPVFVFLPQGMREILCSSRSGFADPSSGRGVRPLAASCSPELLTQPFVTRGPKLSSPGLGIYPAVITTIGCVFSGLFQTVWRVAICILNGCMLHLNSVFCELVVKWS